MTDEAHIRVWHISDTHMNHQQLAVVEDVDVVVHSGDATNARDPFRNEFEMRTFLDWFARLSIKNKIFVPGNHDTSLEKGLVTRDDVRSLGIHLLLTDEVTVMGKRFWGSPMTPSYGDWSYMINRSKIDRVWQTIPEGIDVLVTHGPPYGVLDATYTQSNTTELVGCGALMKRVSKLQPKAMLFGHIHSTSDIRNAGTRTVNGLRTLFSNGSCCDDGKMGVVTSNGNIIVV